MNLKCLCVTLLALCSLAAARPKTRIPNLDADLEPETKIREKRKYEIPLLRELQEGGVGVKRESPREEAPLTAEPEGEKATPSTPAGGGAADEAEVPPPGGLRVKKQSPNNVCIKVGGCGKTVCGPIVSAHGPAVRDMRALMQGGKPIISLTDLQSAALSDMSDVSSKVDRFTPVQGRTVDTIVAPVALGTLGYGTPAPYSASAPALDLAHSFFKPPSVPVSVPALALITTPHQPSHPLVHPWLMPHLLPHLMPHLLPSLTPYFTPHRIDPARLPELPQSDFKQPIPALPPPPYAIGGDSTLLCQPYRNQRLEGPYDYFYKPDLPVDKSINVTERSTKSRVGGASVDLDEEKKVRDHLQKVNEIKDEIRELNRAAQRIVDQQERLTAMQQKQLWSGTGQTTSQASDQMSSPYMGAGYYQHPAMPWGYSRSNILAYPRSQDDIEFFLNLLRAGKKMGLLSDTMQPSVLSTIGEALKGVTDTTKSQKNAAEGSGQPDATKTTKPDNKPST